MTKNIFSDEYRRVYWSAALLLPALWLWGVSDIPFFWDTIQLASKHAHFFYENQLHWALLPPDIDSGHPPVLGYYLACIWTVFGKSLAASHWAMYPFLVALVYQIGLLGAFFSPKYGGWLLPILCLDPVLLGQASLVSPDIVVLLGLLTCINGILQSQKAYTIIGAVLLCSISMRGMMCAAALAFWVFWQQPKQWSVQIKALWPLLPGALLGLLFLLWHHKKAGWTGHFEGSTWSGAFTRVDGKGLVRNTAILAWRWLDMNRFWVWGILLAIAFRQGLRLFYQQHITWIRLVLSLVLFLTPSALMYQNLSAHRYFLPIFAALGVWVFAAICKAPIRLKTGYFASLAVALVLGNCWVYPRGVSMDWDSTLAHLPYHQLRAEVLQELDKNSIGWHTVGTSFPNLNTNEHILLNGDQRKMEVLDFDKNSHIITSNVLNDIDEPEYAILQRDWVLVRRWGGWPVWFEWYKKRK